MLNPAKLLIVTGIVITVLGCALLVAPKIPWLGRLPGDIHVERRNFSFHFPIVTCIVLSILLTIIMNLFMRRR